MNEQVTVTKALALCPRVAKATSSSLSIRMFRRASSDQFHVERRLQLML